MTDTEKDWRELTDEEVGEKMQGRVDASLKTWRHWSVVVDALVEETDLSREEALLVEILRHMHLTSLRVLQLTEAHRDYAKLVSPIIEKQKEFIEEHEEAEDWRDG